jgi:hypothetical protein
MQFNLRRMRINQSGYNDHGQYYGIGQPIYVAVADSNGTDHREIYLEFRAPGREAAKNHVRKSYPAARFYR